jgi:peptidoglycan/xylan/chitin deacetylase (PgdA/CDA1 family)
MAQSIKATGVKELRRELRKMGNDLEDLKALNLDVATLVSDRAKDIVPRRTGTLADTIRPAGTKTAGRVRAGFKRVPYAGVIHFGWPARRIEPQPFLYDALDQRRGEVFDRYFDGIKKIQRKAGL